MVNGLQSMVHILK